MRNKLKLAIISIILQAGLQWIRDAYPALLYTGDGMYTSLRYILPILRVLSILGVLPFLIALLKSKAFIIMLTGESDRKVESTAHDDRFLRHFGIRILAVLSVCLIFFMASGVQKGLSGAYLIIYGIVLLFGIGIASLAIEAVVLYKRKRNYSASGNLLLIVIMLCLLLGYM